MLTSYIISVTDDVVIWEKVLSESEIDDIMDNGPYHDIPTDEGSLGKRGEAIGQLTSYVAL